MVPPFDRKGHFYMLFGSRWLKQDSAVHTIGKLFSFNWFTMDLTGSPPLPPLSDTLPGVEDAIRASPPLSDVPGSVHIRM